MENIFIEKAVFYTKYLLYSTQSLPVINAPFLKNYTLQGFQYRQSGKVVYHSFKNYHIMLVSD